MDIVLCDDHRMVMQSMGGLLEAHGHHVAATTTTMSTLADLVARHNPDVCVTDLSFPDDEDVLETITTVSLNTDVVVLTGVSAPEELEAARDAGAVAVGSKALPSGEIVALVEGRSGTGQSDRPSPAGGHAHFLTEREIEVLQCLTDGESTAHMAQILGVSEATTRSHVQSVLLKLGVHNRLGAVAVGVRHGLIRVAS